MLRIWIAIISAVCVALVLAALRPSARIERRPASSDQATVTLALLTPGPVPPNTPVMLEITIANLTGSAITIPIPTLSERDTPYNTLDMYVSESGSPMQRIAYVVPNVSPWKEGLVPPRPTVETLVPGQSIVVDAAISYDWVPYAEVPLIQTGPVAFKAHLCNLTTDGTGQVDVVRAQGADSNTVSLAVTVPPGEPAALAAVTAMDKPWLISAPQLAGIAGRESDLQALQDLVAKHAGSVYATYARAAMAYMLAAGDRRDGRIIRVPDVSSAARLADIVLKDSRFALRKETAAWRKTLQSEAPKETG